jgi:hypothetical protein
MKNDIKEKFRKQIENLTWGIVWREHDMIFGKEKIPGEPYYHPQEAAEEILKIIERVYRSASQKQNL